MINAEFILQQGIDSCRQGQFFEAESEFWRAHQLCIEESDLGGATRVLMIAAISFEEAGLSSKGSVFYEEAEKLLADTSNSQIHAATALSLAHLLDGKGFGEKASDAYLSAALSYELVAEEARTKGNIDLHIDSLQLAILCWKSRYKNEL